MTSSTLFSLWSMVIILAWARSAQGAPTASARDYFDNLDAMNGTSRTTASRSPTAGKFNFLCESVGKLLANVSEETKAFQFRMFYTLCVKSRFNRTFPVKECLERQCHHSNRRYNCGLSNVGFTVTSRAPSQSESGTCVQVDMKEKTYNVGRVCFAELWLNNGIVRDLLRDGVAGQQGVLTVSSAVFKRTLNYSMSASAKTTHRWAMLNIPEIVDTWASDNESSNYTYNVCWKPKSAEEVDTNSHMPNVRMKRLHSQKLNLSDINHISAKPFFIFGVFPDEKPTLPSPPKVTKPTQNLLYSGRRGFNFLRPGRS